MVDNLTSPAFIKNAGIKAENIENIKTIYSYRNLNYLIKKNVICNGVISYAWEQKINIPKIIAGEV